MSSTIWIVAISFVGCLPDSWNTFDDEQSAIEFAEEEELFIHPMQVIEIFEIPADDDGEGLESW